MNQNYEENNRFQNFDPNDLDFKNQDNEATSILKNIILGIEKLEEHKSDISAQIRDAFAHAKNEGFDLKILKKILSLRKMKPEKAQEEEMLIQHYKKILGMK
jgi:uncharacterized protein (UPF0335 family)